MNKTVAIFIGGDLQGQGERNVPVRGFPILIEALKGCMKCTTNIEQTDNMERMLNTNNKEQTKGDVHTTFCNMVTHGDVLVASLVDRNWANATLEDLTSHQKRIHNTVFLLLQPTRIYLC